MEPLHCIIVDDEEGAHLVIGHYLQGVKTLQLDGSFYNAVEAMDHIYKNRVDLVFLDINMPGLSGMEMLAAMLHPPLVVLTTAYAAFALESYKYQVVDYLVKPIEFPRFLAAVDRVIQRYKPVAPTLAAEQAASRLPDYLVMKDKGDYVKVMLADILYVQSWGNYVKIHTEQGTHLSSMTTTEVENKLDKTKFKRIHKSYIVALTQIQKITGTEVCLKNGQHLPLGNTFKRELLEYFQ